MAAVVAPVAAGAELAVESSPESIPIDSLVKSLILLAELGLVSIRILSAAVRAVDRLGLDLLGCSGAKRRCSSWLSS